jgi:hypothetical protein
MAYKNIVILKLIRLKNGKISSSLFDYELLENSLFQNQSERGW